MPCHLSYVGGIERRIEVRALGVGVGGGGGGGWASFVRPIYLKKKKSYLFLFCFSLPWGLTSGAQPHLLPLNYTSIPKVILF
jgi:hypothetical protein